MPNLRLIPVVIFAAVCLLAIKTIGFIAVGEQPATSAWNPQSEIWNRITGNILHEDDMIVTGTTPGTTPAAPPGQPMAALPTVGAAPDGSDKKPVSDSAAERALIERLQERRKELEARARDLELRESLIKAAEKQLDSKIGELHGGDGKDAAAPERIKSLVVMYEAMGPKEAARIFDRLDARTLVDLVNRMNPRKVSEIMARMQPEAAERMTLELARGRGQVDRALPASDLRRIAPTGAR